MCGALVVASCSGSTGDDGPADPGPQFDGDPPTGLTTGLIGEEAAPELEVRFAPTAEADAYLLAFDERQEPVRVEAADCAGDVCRVVLDRFTAADATSVAVAAVAGDATSRPSEEVPLPDWPSPPPVDEPEAGPTPLVVTRRDPAGKPVVETEIVPVGEDVEARVAGLEAADDVVGVGLDLRGLATGVDQGEGDDESYPDGLATWQQEAFDFRSLPPEPRGDGVTVAVIDSGVDEGHPAFQGADITVTNMVEPGRSTPDHHGTSTTSLIVGQPGGRVPGIASAATVRAYDVFNGAEEFSSSAVARAIIQAVDEGADVINLSLSSRCKQVGPWHFSCPPGGMQAAVEYAESQGVVIVAAAGNDGDGAEFCVGGNPVIDESNGDQWPAKYPTVIAVGATTRRGDPWVCSPDKDYIDVLAPGDALLVATTGDDGPDYAVRSGTSLSTPLVAGLVAAILAERPELTPAEIRDLLTNATDEHGRLMPVAVMAALGLHEGDIRDPTTLRAILPFAAQLTYLDGHPVRTVADELHAIPVDDTTWIGEMWEFYENEGEFEIMVGGVLLVDRDGSVSGWARATLSRGLSTHYGPVLARHEVHCPSGRPTINPLLAYGWEVEAVVGGQVDDQSRGDAPQVELSLSFGHGATPEAAGALPGLVVLEDTLRKCPAEIDLENRLGRAERTWEEVQAQRDHNIPALEELYGAIVDESPIEFTAAYPRRLEPGVGALQSGDQLGDMNVHIWIGPDPGP